MEERHLNPSTAQILYPQASSSQVSDERGKPLEIPPIQLLPHPRSLLAQPKELVAQTELGLH